MKKRTRAVPTPEEFGAELAAEMGKEYQAVILKWAKDQPMTFDDVLALVVATIPNIDFINFTYSHDEDDPWSTTIHVGRDGFTDAVDDTQEGALFLAWLKVISGKVEWYHD